MALVLVLVYGYGELELLPKAGRHEAMAALLSVALDPLPVDVQPKERTVRDDAPDLLLVQPGNLAAANGMLYTSILLSY